MDQALMNVALFSYEIFCLFNCLVLLLDDKGVFEVCLALLHFIYPATDRGRGRALSQDMPKKLKLKCR